MAINTKEMINSWVAFAKKAIQASAAAEASQEIDSKAAREFQATVRAFNDDPDNLQTRPFYFINRVSESVSPVAELDLNRLLLDADAEGLSAEFLKGRSEEGDVTLFFSHAVTPLATELCEKYGLGYANLGANGICLPGFVFTGLISATPDQLKATLLEANAYLATV
jgi:hypothetical protein